MDQTSLRRAVALFVPRRLVVAVLAATVGMSAASAAQARQQQGRHLADLNQRVTAAPGWKSAAAELFPKLAMLSPAPDDWMSDRQATLMTPESPDWTKWADWAGAEPQQAALAALAVVTDPKQRYTLGLPYGEAGVDPQWVQAGLYVDLGRPEMTARAPMGMKYLDQLSTLSTLATLEAARLAEAGDGAGAVGVVLNWLRLARMVADREFLPEKQWGLTQMIAATERLRDLATLYPDLFDETHTQRAVDDLDQRSLTPERIRFPDGERQGLLELLSLAMEEGGSAKPEKFATVMGQVTAEGRAFNAFSQAAHWAQLAATHADYHDTRDEINKVFGGWQQRWDLNNIFDPIMREPTDYSRMDPQRFAMIQALVEGMEGLFDLRTRLLVSITGTRTAMGVVGFRSRFNQWPPNLMAVQPQFVRSLDYDPWSYDQKLGTSQVFRYFVPVRDARVGPRETPGPHAMQVLIVRDESLAGADASDGDPSGGVFPPFVARAFRDALADGLPSGLFQPDTGAIRIGPFRDHLSHELDKLAFEPTTMKNLKELAKKLDEASAAALVAMVEPDRLVNPEMQRARAELEALVQQLSAALNDGLPESFKTADGQLDANMFRETALTRIRESEIPQAAKEAMIAQIEKLSEAQLRLALEAIRSVAGGTDGPLLNFSVELTDDTFVLYSVGKDGRPGGARAVGNAAGAADLIVFPAPITLERMYLSSRK